MSIYDEGKRKNTVIRLTKHQSDKLKHVCSLFAISQQRLFTDMLDIFYMEYLDVMSGRVNINTAIKTSMISLLDDYVRLKEIKGLKPPSYRQKNSPSFQRGGNVL